MQSAKVVWATRFLVLGVIALATHCSGQTVGETNPQGDPTPTPDAAPDVTVKDGGSDVTQPQPAKVHRAVATACSETRPPAKPGDAGAADAGFPGSCSTDADCTEGKNGRCISGRVTACDYDQCFKDDDCGAGFVCDCGAEYTGGRAGHRCLKSDCRVDADCASGFCSPTLDESCGQYGGRTGYHCHTPKDECVNDDTCAAQGKIFCGFKAATGNWVCSNAMCVG